jgi:uncharacterized Ntn-hydrolase superfamily protein
LTFSIIAKEGKEFGIGVASGSVGVGKRVPWVERGVGAVATQGLTEPSYGPRILELLRKGLEPVRCLSYTLADDPLREFRQVLVLAETGGAAHTGMNCPAFCGHVVGENFVCGGNLLVGREVLEAMIAEFKGAFLAEKLLSSLVAGAEAGGDRRGERSAAILITGPSPIRLEIEDSADPLVELEQKVKKIIHKGR